MSSPIQAVVFDWAGTMIDHGCRAPVIALRRIFDDAGCPITEAETRADMGVAKRDHIRRLLATPRIASAWRLAHGALATEADIDRLHDAVEPMMRIAARDSAALIPGALDAVGYLKARGVRIGSSTGYTRPMMADILPLAAAQGYAPEVVVCAGETPLGRPSPLMMWKNLVELGVWPAHAAIKVDDAEVGVAEGRAAGAWTVGLSASGNGVGLDRTELQALSAAERDRRVSASAARLRAAGADYVIGSVAELPQIFDAISERLLAGERPGHEQ